MVAWSWRDNADCVWRKSGTGIGSGKWEGDDLQEGVV